MSNDEMAGERKEGKGLEQKRDNRAARRMYGHCRIGKLWRTLVRCIRFGLHFDMIGFFPIGCRREKSGEFKNGGCGEEENRASASEPNKKSWRQNQQLVNHALSSTYVVDVSSFHPSVLLITLFSTR